MAVEIQEMPGNGVLEQAVRAVLTNPSASFRLENQVAVVTGGARGIGAGIVRRFVQEGARVVFSDLLNEKGTGRISIANITPMCSLSASDGSKRT